MTRPNHCSSCGATLDEPDADGGSRCSKCGRTHYDNPAPTVGAVIVRDGRALITERARDPHKGRSDVPGGFLHVGEDAIEGLKREVREELGIEIDVGPEDLIQASPHRYGDDGGWVLSFGFRARPLEGEPMPADDVASYCWVDANELDDLEWAWDHDRELVRKALARQRPQEEGQQ